MKRDELWELLVRKNPAFGGKDDEHITQTVRGLRKLFNTAYDQGHEQGVANGRAAEAMEQSRKPKTDDSIFGKIFGNKFP